MIILAKISPEDNFDETVVENSPIVEHLFDPSFSLSYFNSHTHTFACSPRSVLSITTVHSCVSNIRTHIRKRNYLDQKFAFYFLKRSRQKRERTKKKKEEVLND